MKQGHRLGSYFKIQEENGDALDQEGSSGGAQKWSGSS